MAVPELIPQSEIYEDSSPLEFLPVEEGKVHADERVAMIIGGILLVEPRQYGVLRYPPVQVDVKRDPGFIAEYVRMGPTDWQRALHGLEPDDQVSS
jgi:hypothetical protein